MAINETSVDGKKYRQKTTDGWKWYSFITKAKDILFGDGEDVNNNLETNLGSFKGITTSTNVTETGYAADATVVSDLNNSLTADNAQAFQFAYDSESGKYGYKVKEADTDVFVPFSSGGLVTVTDSFSLTNPLLNVNGMNSNLGFVIYSLYPIDFTDIQSITHQFQYISYVSSNICISITDEQLTTSADIVANATLKIPFSASNSWVFTNVSTLDTSNISGKKYIGLSMENYTQSDFLNLTQFTLNKG